MPVCMYGSVCLYKVFVRFEFVRFCMCSRCVRFWYERGKNVCFVCDCVIVCQNPILFRFESKLSKYNGMLWLPSTHAHTANPFNHSVEMRECVLSGEIFPYAKSISLSFSSILFLLSMLPQFKSIQFNSIQSKSNPNLISHPSKISQIIIASPQLYNPFFFFLLQIDLEKNSDIFCVHSDPDELFLFFRSIDWKKRRKMKLLN